MTPVNIIGTKLGIKQDDMPNPQIKICIEIYNVRYLFLN